jgi:uncharacterized membrane protein YbaN (DUF454 family)
MHRRETEIEKEEETLCNKPSQQIHENEGIGRIREFYIVKTIMLSIFLYWYETRYLDNKIIWIKIVWRRKWLEDGGDFILTIS